MQLSSYNLLRVLFALVLLVALAQPSSSSALGVRDKPVDKHKPDWPDNKWDHKWDDDKWDHKWDDDKWDHKWDDDKWDHKWDDDKWDHKWDDDKWDHKWDDDKWDHKWDDDKWDHKWDDDKWDHKWDDDKWDHKPDHKHKPSPSKWWPGPTPHPKKPFCKKGGDLTCCQTFCPITDPWAKKTIEALGVSVDEKDHDKKVGLTCEPFHPWEKEKCHGILLCCEDENKWDGVIDFTCVPADKD